MEDQITLIAATAFDLYGNATEYTQRAVLCEVRSASRSEFYQAAQAGIRPELEVWLFFADYAGEKFARHNGTVYHVVRTYRGDGDSDRIQLTLERYEGVLPGLQEVE